jgi:phenylalanine-4-hydroxylase
MPASGLPPSLRRYVVEQDYTRYDAADQAVWRFVLLHLERHLEHVAHESYIEGLRGSALSPEAIPHIGEVDAALGRFGLGAVCVDGFIPPRVFQRFQALGVLPIAADIRTPSRVAYTPAPDIIHEAAGHAPILINPEYSEYLRRSGEIAERAFACPEDHAVTHAVTELSRVKEAFPEGSSVVRQAELSLNEAVAKVVTVSEAARMARLYWWTAEYGLIGTPARYKLYGAGLLSSLGEAVYCLDDAVRKLPLDLGCLEVGYDITRPQPQLFVTPSFAALFEVLADLERSLAAAQGVERSLEAAKRSQLPCRITTSNGGSHEGILLDYEIGMDVSRLSFQRDHARIDLLVGSMSPEETERRWQERAYQHDPSRIVRVDPADDLVEAKEGARIGPSVRQLDPAERDLRMLYEEASLAWRRRFGQSFVPTFERVHRVLVERYPHEWLLRWNLLENLLELGETEKTQDIARELELLERHYQEREPIATGLRSLRARVARARTAEECAS